MNLSDVKRNMHKTVKFSGSEYFLWKCVMWLDEKNNEFKYSLILVDKNKNSTVDVPIEKVTVLNNER